MGFFVVSLLRMTGGGCVLNDGGGRILNDRGRCILNNTFVILKGVKDLICGGTLRRFTPQNDGGERGGYWDNRILGYKDIKGESEKVT